MKNRPVKLGKQTGSLFNYLMSQNSSIPKVGEGATISYWTDRDAYEVLEVNEPKKTCVIQKYSPKRIDRNGMSDAQTYEYKELDGRPFTIYHKWGSWKTRSEGVVFEDKFLSNYPDFSSKVHDAYKAAGGTYNDIRIDKVIPGITKKKVSWNTINIIFGVKRQYYDFSF